MIKSFFKKTTPDLKDPETQQDTYALVVGLIFGFAVIYFTKTFVLTNPRRLSPEETTINNFFFDCQQGNATCFVVHWRHYYKNPAPNMSQS